MGRRGQDSGTEQGGQPMKIVVIGGTGRLGSKLVVALREHGHDVVPAAPNTGVNTITGEGVAEAMRGTDVVVDVSNSPSFDDGPVLEFFTTSTRNLLGAEADAGVGHHVAMSIVGADRVPDSGYLRAKVAQEELIVSSSIPYSIVRATQFFEFVDSILASMAEGEALRASSALLQPMAVDDVAQAVGKVAAGAPLNGRIEIAGPEVLPLDELLRRTLAARHDPRVVVTDPHARYFGAELAQRDLIPGPGAELGSTTFEDWLARSLSAA
jgi:uncharacterized protein YbjT (DUF2867 family)